MSLCVVRRDCCCDVALFSSQVAIEGALSKDVVRQSLGRGLRPSGDLIPWTMSQHFVDEDFGSLTGVRPHTLARRLRLSAVIFASV